MQTHFSHTLQISWSIICLSCPSFFIAYLKLSLPSKKWISFGSLCRRHVRCSTCDGPSGSGLACCPAKVGVSQTRPWSSPNHLEIFPTLKQLASPRCKNPGGRCSHQSCQHPTRNSCWPAEDPVGMMKTQMQIKRTFQLFQTHFNKKNYLFFWCQISKSILGTETQKSYSGSKRNSPRLCH